VTATIVTLCIGTALGLLFGIHMTVRTGFVDRVAAKVGDRVLHEHRAYRLALAQQVGSTREADRLMTVYQREEVL
jgi:hypothetical protein